MFDLTGWGLVHIVVGGPGGEHRHRAAHRCFAWARSAHGRARDLNAVAQLAFVAVYPVWSLIVIALCVVVIWAVVVHGDEAGLDGV